MRSLTPSFSQAHAGSTIMHSFVYDHATPFSPQIRTGSVRSCTPLSPQVHYWMCTFMHAFLCEGSCWVYDHALLCLRSCKPFLPTGSCWVYVHTLLSLRRFMLGLRSLTPLSTILHPFLPTDSCWAYVDSFLLPRRFILGLYVHALLSPRRFTWI